MVSADGGVFLVSSGCEQVSTFHSRDMVYHLEILPSQVFEHFFSQGEGFYSNQGLPRIFTRVHERTATTAGLNDKTADVNTRVFSYALSVNSAWTSGLVDVDLKEKRSTMMS